MRYRIKNYTTEGQVVILQDTTLNSIEDLRLVINLTQGIVIYSPMDRSGIVGVMKNGFEVETNVCELNEKTPDQLLIEIDKGDKMEIDIDTTELAKEGDNPDATNSKILEETLKVSDAQAQIDQLLAIQLETIIGKDENIE